MTARTDDISRQLERTISGLQHHLAELAELDRYAPDEVAAVVGSLVAHLRSWRPEAIRDPRGVQ